VRVLAAGTGAKHAVNVAKASREFNEGLRNIERAVIEGVLRKCGSNIGVSHDLTWHPGDFDVPPETIVLRVRKAGRKIDQTFDRVEVEDSWDRVDRSDTRTKIEEMVEAACR